MNQEEKLRKALDFNREQKKSHQKERLQKLDNQLLSLTEQIVQLEKQRKKLKTPGPVSILCELKKHGALIFLGNSDDLIELEDNEFGPIGPKFLEPKEELDVEVPRERTVVVDYWEFPIQVDFRFDATGYKYTEHVNFRTDEDDDDPLGHLEEALEKAELPFKVTKISKKVPVHKWKESLEEIAYCGLKEETVNVDHHYPSKGRGKGHLIRKICVLKIRDSQ